MAEDTATSVIPGPAIAAAEQLVDLEIQRWHEGAAPSAEAFLEQHPEIRAHADGAIRLIYEEICLRREGGQDVASVEVLRRFPEWEKQLQLLLQCHRLLDLQSQPPIWPAPGESLGEFWLLAELGRGAVGRVFLAAQAGLADRQVVLKLTPCSGEEHLSLARLQHTHIVPLYTAHEDAARKLRVLCLPYFGGAPLQHVLAGLQARPPAERTGRHVLEALDQLQQQTGLSLPARGPLRHLLGRASYVQAICLIGACLADALQYAHERGLIHLDIKPSNVLLAADAQPMLLDFHVAQGPIRPGDVPEGLGGTVVYMSPEQRAAMTAVKKSEPVSTIVDGRSDIYSLGLLLYEALGGDLPAEGESSALMLRRHNPRVPGSLAKVVAKCLAADPRTRYQDAGQLAADLRRQLRTTSARSNAASRPTWRGLLVVAAAVLMGVTALGLRRVGAERETATTALAEGRQLLRRGDYALAMETLTRGQTAAARLPGGGALAQQLEDELRRARRAQAADNLHTLAEQMRFHYGGPSAAPAALPWRALWDKRAWLLERREAELDSAVERRLEMDLLDLALMWADLQVRHAEPGKADKAQHEALRVLEEAEDLFGSSTALCRQRQACAAALGLADVAAETERRAASLAPRTAWEHCALGRSLLQSGDLERAAPLLDRAVALEPQSFWPNFYQGICAYRLKRYAEAVGSFRVCVALAPASADCYYNRGLTYAALEEDEKALRDYDQSLQLNPRLASAALNRGLLYYRQGQYEKALADLEHARGCGGDEATVCYNLALVHLARRDRAAAFTSVQQALQADPRHPEVRRLRQLLQKGPLP